MSKVSEWLSEFSNERTRITYASRIDLFFKATGSTEELMLSMTPDEIKSKILNYRREELAKGVSQNTVLSNIVAVRSFCAQINKPVKFRRGMLGKVEADNDSHIFSNGDLKHLFEVGDTQEKAILSLAASLGWEISSFLELTRDKIDTKIRQAKANNESFVFFEDTRAKTSESRLAVINPLAITWVGNYLATRKDDDPRLFLITQDGIQKMLSRLAVNCGMILGKEETLRFHNIRKWLMSRLSRAGFNEFQIKFILGKAIGVSDRTYLQTLQVEIEEKYPKLYNDYLNINPETSSEALKQTSATLSTVKNDIVALNTKINLLTQENFELKFKLNDTMGSLVSALEEKLGIKIDLSKILSAHEAKYSKEGSKFYQSLQEEDQKETRRTRKEPEQEKDA